MAKIPLIQTNFTAGELSPRLAGRPDIAKYNNGLKTCENARILIQGGAERRPGTRMVAEVKDSTKRVRLLEFIFNREQAYVLEAGDNYLRFFKNDGAQIEVSGTPYEISSPFAMSMLPYLEYVQRADTMFVAHEAAPIQRLQRFADSDWAISPTPFNTVPVDELGHKPGASLSLSSASIGGARVATASASAFLPGDSGRGLAWLQGNGTIVAVLSDVVALVNISSPFKSVSVPAGQWTIQGSPQVFISPSDKSPFGASISLVSALPMVVDIELSDPDVGTGRTVTAGGAVFSAGDVGKSIYADSGVLTITAFTDSTHVTGDVTRLFVNKKYPANGWGKTGDAWRAEDVGKTVSMNNGLVRIDSFVDAAHVIGTIRDDQSAAVAPPPSGWRLLSAVWNSELGYPRSVTLHEQRLFAAGSPGRPQFVWASQIGGYLSFEPGTADDDAFGYELVTDQVAPIAHLTQSRRLMALTFSNTMSLRGGVEKPITPTNIQKNDEAQHGANEVRPVKVGNELLFVQRAGRKVRALGYKYDIDGFDGPDRTVFSEHITESGINDMAFQQEPDALLFCVRNDGQLAVSTYDTEQEVNAWGRWTLGGVVESVATVPTATGEQTWLVVRRTINGVQKRYIEYFDPGLSLDCAITGTDGPGKATWGGLAHLEGRVVQALADGVYQGEFTVVGGEITLPRTANTVEIGLGFTTTLTMLTPEVPGGSTAQGAAVSVGEVIVRVMDTQSVIINGQEVTFRRFGSELLDQPPASQSGDIRETTLSDEIYRNELVITQDKPVNFHVLAVIRKCTIND